MRHKVNLEWKAFRYDMSARKIEIFNVIREDLIEDIEKAHRKKMLNTMAELKIIVNSWAMYHYWSKVEHEVMIYDLFDSRQLHGKKVDVFWQLDMNMDRLCEYIATEMRLFE